MVTTSIRLQSPLAGDRDRLKTIRFRHDENKFVFIILSVVEFRGIFACFSSLSAKNIIRNLWPGVISETFKVSYFFQILKTFVLLLNQHAIGRQAKEGESCNRFTKCFLRSSHLRVFMSKMKMPFLLDQSSNLLLMIFQAVLHLKYATIPNHNNQHHLKASCSLKRRKLKLQIHAVLNYLNS